MTIFSLFYNLFYEDERFSSILKQIGQEIKSIFIDQQKWISFLLILEINAIENETWKYFIGFLFLVLLVLRGGLTRKNKMIPEFIITFMFVFAKRSIKNHNMKFTPGFLIYTKNLEQKSGGLLV